MVALAVTKILLSPVLLLQGWWVRRNTPELPEPVIQPEGLVGQGSPFSLLLLGDSSAAGVGAPNAEQSLLGQLLSLLTQNHQVRYRMIAQTGKTTAEMLADLLVESPQQYDLVVTALGVNDVTSQVSLSRWRKQQIQLIKAIQEKYTPKQIIMSGLPPVGDFPALKWPLSAYMGAYADQLDALLKTLLESHEDIEFLTLRGYPEEAQAASDGFHPGPVVYRMWAENIVRAIDKATSE